MKQKNTQLGVVCFNGADDEFRTHEMPESQSGALTPSPRPPCMSLTYSTKFLVKCKAIF